MEVGSTSAELIVLIEWRKSIIRVRHLVLIPMKEDSPIEEIFGRFRLFGQDAYHDDEDLDACWPVAADGIGRLRFVKVMLSSMQYSSELYAR